MYIKVNKRFSRLRGCQKLQFSVIESYRENGKVKHRTLAYLATIPEKALKYAAWLESFWRDSERKLESFTDADKARLVSRLETLVPRPSEEMYEEAKKRKEEYAVLMSRLTSRL